MKKCVLLLLDGLGDRSFAQFGNLTPLQAAHTPHLDQLAEIGCSGLFHAAVLGQALPSENAHFAMFGYDLSDFPGRGVLEALGAGIALTEADVAVLARFVTLREKDGILFLEKDQPPATAAEAEALARFVSEYESGGIRITFTRSQGLYGILTLRGEVDRHVTDTAPFVDGRALSALKPWKGFENSPKTANTICALRSHLLWLWESLREHPVNIARKKEGKPCLNGMVTQRAGQMKKVVPFYEKWGLKGLSLASGIVYHGLAAFVGMESRKVRDTDDPGKDLAQRLHMACNLLNEYDFIHVHTKTPDEAAHTKNPENKKKVIESLDRGIGEAIAPLLENPDVLLIITADHSTPSTGPLVHSGEPVPMTFCGQGIRKDAVRHFDEVSAAAGALGNVRGQELMYLILNHTDRAKLRGIMDTPDDQPYWPGHYEAFRL